MKQEEFYEEALNAEEVYIKEKKYNFKWLIWIIIILLLFFFGLLTFWKLTEKEKPEEEVVEDITEEEKIDLDCDDTCNYTLDVDGSEVTLTYTKTIGKEDEEIHKLELDGTELVNRSFACGGPAVLTVLKDTILISYHDGCDITGNSIYAYTKEGKEIFHYETFDTIYNMWMSGTEFTVKGNQISIPATRVYHGPTLRLNELEEVNICENGEWELYHVDSNTVSGGSYIITYLGNNQFSDPVLEEEQYLKDIVSTCNLED